MGTDTTKQNIDELITSFIDDQDPAAKERIAAMLENDDVLQKKYRSELLTKNFLRKKLGSVDVPEKSYLRVTSSIDSLILNARGSSHVPSEHTSFAQYLKNFFLSPIPVKSFPVPRYAVALVLVVAVLFIGILASKQKHDSINPYIALGSDKNVMVQAVNNFHRIQSGEVKPEIMSRDAKEVSTYLKHKVNFEPFVPVISDFDLLGCICDKFPGENLAHLVYGSGNNIIYVYQTDFNSVKQKQKRELPDAVYDQMMKEKYYMCDKVDEANCTLMLWYSDNVLCASVSNLSKNNLYNKFITVK